MEPLHRSRLPPRSARRDSTIRHTTARDALYAFCGLRTPQPRTIIVAAHPDDEIIGAGARIAALRDVIIIHTTDGSPGDARDANAAGIDTPDSYAAARRAELRRALAIAGRHDARAHCLGFPDQRCAHALVTLARALTDNMTMHADVLVTHAYEGGHPDHDATAFAVHAALALLARQGRPVPVLLEMTGYHLHRGAIRTGTFLPAAGVTELSTELSYAERKRKRRMLRAFRTQAATLAQFRVHREVFRTAPVHDFTRPPNPEGAYYDRFAWGLDSRDWPRLVREAVRELRLDDFAC